MKKFFLIVSSLFISYAGFSQSADFITKLISTEQATFGQVCYLSAVYQGFVEEDASETEAMNALFERKMLPANSGADSFITYKGVASIFSRFWKVNGGLFYRLSGGSARYAFRQFRLDGVIPSKTDPSMIPSGTEVLNIYTLGDSLYESVAAEGAE